MFFKHVFAILCVAAGLIVACTPTSLLHSDAEIRLDPKTTYQTMLGWEATAYAGQFRWQPGLFEKWQNAVLDQAANDLGINRVRLELQTGVENPNDYFTPFLQGHTTEQDWENHINEVINDNDSPDVINPAGFNFISLDQTIDTVVVPLQQRLQHNGEKLYVNMTVVDFQNPADQSNLRFQYAPAEYAEFVLATFLHMQEKYGWTPDAVEVILEPDKAGWGNGTNVGNALVAAGKRLAEHGFTPDHNRIDHWRGGP